MYRNESDGPRSRVATPFQVVPVLLVPRQVEPVLLALVAPDGGQLIVAVLHPARVGEAHGLSVADGIAADRTHHEEDDRDDDPEDRDRPEQAAKDETGDTLRVPGS
jgi:hypothetical protein